MCLVRPSTSDVEQKASRFKPGMGHVKTAIHLSCSKYKYPQTLLLGVLLPNCGVKIADPKKKRKWCRIAELQIRHAHLNHNVHLLCWKYKYPQTLLLIIIIIRGATAP
ncbi:hypothetical protein CDAR_296731 [Caerostris darwini]|uniref:Uncharacterized protein n=1 Tax=Caerostris darwini TaxID=1538125 RepID=A0AAV4N8Z9_9ARAC|nr:hypothetical protein CDAR_296731 [Caerostris darwini]